jgi:hypothetical protein
VVAALILATWITENPPELVSHASVSLSAELLKKAGIIDYHRGKVRVVEPGSPRIRKLRLLRRGKETLPTPPQLLKTPLSDRVVSRISYVTALPPQPSCRADCVAPAGVD